MNPEENVQGNARSGTLAALLCYVLWGVFPVYWKLLGEVNSFEVIANRVIWCFVTTVVICRVMRVNWTHLLHERRAWRFLLPAGAIITFNWSIYIYAVDIGHIIETSIGYYTNPLVSILFGVVFFHERLTPLQKVAVGLCAAGLVFFTVSYGQFPWIAMLLAFSFGLYGAIKKKGSYPAVPALAFENTVMLPVAAAIYAAVVATTGTHALLADTATPHGWAVTALLVGAGPATAVPLILFATAANRIPLTMLGFIQYLSPTIALLIGVFGYGEPFTLAHGVCLGLIWCGLALVSFDMVRRARS